MQFCKSWLHSLPIGFRPKQAYIEGKRLGLKNPVREIMCSDQRLLKNGE
jgi:hypothetical protein